MAGTPTEWTVFSGHTDMIESIDSQRRRRLRIHLVTILREFDALGRMNELSQQDLTRVEALRTQAADLLFRYRDLPDRSPNAPGGA
jgi:hypothetical protein